MSTIKEFAKINSVIVESKILSEINLILANILVLLSRHKCTAHSNQSVVPEFYCFPTALNL